MKKTFLYVKAVNKRCNVVVDLPLLILIAPFWRCIVSVMSVKLDVLRQHLKVDAVAGHANSKRFLSKHDSNINVNCNFWK